MNDETKEIHNWLWQRANEEDDLRHRGGDMYRRAALEVARLANVEANCECHDPFEEEDEQEENEPHPHWHTMTEEEKNEAIRKASGL